MRPFKTRLSLALSFSLTVTFMALDVLQVFDGHLQDVCFLQLGLLWRVKEAADSTLAPPASIIWLLVDWLEHVVWEILTSSLKAPITVSFS